MILTKDVLAALTKHIEGFGGGRIGLGFNGEQIEPDELINLAISQAVGVGKPFMVVQQGIMGELGELGAQFGSAGPLIGLIMRKAKGKASRVGILALGMAARTA